MATMILGAVGAVFGGSSITTSIVSIAGGVGLGMAGQLLGKKGQNNQPKVTFGTRVDEVYVSGSAENAPIRLHWGMLRLGGNVIWCSNFTEWTSTDVSYAQTQSAGKGGAPKTVWTPNYAINYHYNISFAVAFCVGGPGVSLGRVWADGKELNLDAFAWRFYDGSEDQIPDPWIEAIEGAGNVPAYKGVAYLVFKDMTLDKFGNRMPQITAEIIRRPFVTDPNDISNCLRSVCLIPGSGEFAYSTSVVSSALSAGTWKTENAHAQEQRANILVSLDQLCGLNQASLAASLPTTTSAAGGGIADYLPSPWSVPGWLPSTTGGNWRSAKGALNAADAVSLVVSWFGSDLRAGNCQIVPKVDRKNKNTIPYDWEVAGYSRDGMAWYSWFQLPGWSYGFPIRSTYGTQGAFPLPYGAAASLVSSVSSSVIDPNNTSGTAFGGGLVPAFGGTPSDRSVTEAIQEIKRRGLRCVFYPFILMDIPAGNGLPDPYGGAEQAAFPWRGRITCHPAPGQSGTADGTATAASQISAFFTQYSNMIFHYANLCAQAGGVDAFIIGSELVGLTQVRGPGGKLDYPAVAWLKGIAANLRTILGASTKIGYAADWTEYHSHRPADGSNDVIFNMDPLWSDSNIDFIGIDNYMPLSDWRDAGANVDFDAANGPSNIYDKAYLSRNVEGGEYFDWYYASAADRTAQNRTTIVDGAYGKPWVFRQKDIRNWWLNAHKNRPNGVEDASATSFSPGSKPVWLTEFGCPAIDKGTNQPNVFFDPKSSESFFPYFSSGERDDAIQRTYLEVMLSYWRDNAPTSAAGVKMLETRNMFAWAWDGRPFPDFPAQGAVWHDGPNFELGHWLTGRLAEVPIKWIVAELCAAVDMPDYDTSQMIGPDSLVLGATADGVVSPRDVLAQMNEAYQFDAYQAGGIIHFAWRGAAKTVAISSDNFVVEAEADVGYSLTRAQETELPGAFQISFIDAYSGFAQSSTSATKATGTSRNIAQTSAPTILNPPRAKALARSLLQQAWASRDHGTIKLPPSFLAIDAGDCLSIAIGGQLLSMRAEKISATTFRSFEISGFNPALARISGASNDGSGSRIQKPPNAYGVPIVEFMDLPLATGTEALPYALRVAGFASPWSGMAVYETVNGSNSLAASVISATPMGELTDPLYAGPRSIWDMGNSVYVQMYDATQLLSKSEIEVFGGANAIAVKNAASDQWEIIQFANASLIAPNKYRLTKLLRAQLGTEAGMGAPVPAGARVVVLNPATLATLGMTVDEIGQSIATRVGPARYDPSSASFIDYNATPRAVGLRHYSVSQIRGSWQASGDIALSWLRRTRFGGDAWDPPDVPLNEESESYDLEIVNGAAVVRAVSALSAPGFSYTAAMQTADFGAVQSSLTIRVYQNSAQIGRGQVATATVVK